MKREPEHDWWSPSEGSQPSRLSERAYGTAMARVIGEVKPDAWVFSVPCPKCGTLLEVRKSDIRDHKPNGNGMDVRLHTHARTCAKCGEDLIIGAPVQLRMSEA